MRRAAPHECSRAVAVDQKALLDQPGDGAPQRRAGNLQHLREFALARQQVGLGESPRDDLAPEGRADAFKQRLAFGSDRAKLGHPRLRPPLDL